MLMKKVLGYGFLITSIAINTYVYAESTSSVTSSNSSAKTSYHPDGSANLDKGQKYLDENKKKKDVVTLPSGLQYKVVKEGSGQSPVKDDYVKVHYEGTLIDGTVFDSSEKRGEPVKFPVNAVIPGWTEALQIMKPGAEWVIYIPAKLAYGSRGVPGTIGPNETLIFKVKLLEVLPPHDNEVADVIEFPEKGN